MRLAETPTASIAQTSRSRLGVTQLRETESRIRAIIALATQRSSRETPARIENIRDFRKEAICRELLRGPVFRACSLKTLERNPKVSWLLALLLAGVVGSTPDCTIVEFSKDQCGPCQQLQPALEQLKREGWVVRTVNAELEPLLVRRFAIESVPTIVVLREGREVDRIVGAAPYDKLALRLAKHKSIQADGAGVVPAVLQTPTTQSDRPSPQFNTPVSTPAFSQPTLKSASQPALLSHAPSANQPTAP